MSFIFINLRSDPSILRFRPQPFFPPILRGFNCAFAEKIVDHHEPKFFVLKNAYALEPGLLLS
jgi:hypothetical protein